MYVCVCVCALDGSCTGISLESASPSQLSHLDQLLTDLALLKTTAEINKMAASSGKEDGKVGVATGNKAEPTWGTAVAGVRSVFDMKEYIIE